MNYSPDTATEGRGEASTQQRLSENQEYNTQIFPEETYLLYDKALQGLPPAVEQEYPKMNLALWATPSWWELMVTSLCIQHLASVSPWSKCKGNVNTCPENAQELENQGKTGSRCPRTSPKSLYLQDFSLYRRRHECPCPFRVEIRTTNPLFWLWTIWPFHRRCLIQIRSDCLSCSSIWSFVLA